MRFGDIFERFLQEAPISVMFRALLERALDPDELNRLFEQTTSSQYTRELLFSSVVDLMSLVVCGVKPSVRSASLASLGKISASLTAVYEKLKGIEPGVCRCLVRDTAGLLPPLVRQLDATLPDLVPGYRAKVLDGNHLARDRAPDRAHAGEPRRAPAGSGAGGPRFGDDDGHRRGPVRGRPCPGAIPGRSGAARGRTRRPVDRRPQLLHDPVPLRGPGPSRVLPGPAAPADAALGADDALDRCRPGRHRARPGADDPRHRGGRRRGQ